MLALYAQFFCLAIMLKIMLAYNVQKPTATYYLFHYLFHIIINAHFFHGNIWTHNNIDLFPTSVAS